MASTASAASSAGSASVQAAIAAHRFGLSEPSLQGIGSDPQGWLLSQIGPADIARGDGLLNTPQAWAHARAERRAKKDAKAQPEAVPGEHHFREVIAADITSRLVTAASTQRPFAERLQWFWSNHFTVSQTKGTVRGLVGAFERDAIRPHIAGRFEDMLVASSTHPAMLRYLDNVQSAGPRSRIVGKASRRAHRMGEEPRVSGLNENLAREILELHTLGAESSRDGIYTQRDVTSFAAVLTGWRISLADDARGQLFDADWHEPGRKTVLGKSYPEGPDALRMVLRDLARHPATAKFISTKLARHFVADDPPPELVDQLAATYLRSDGQLGEVYQALIRSPLAWNPAPSKLKTPEEFVVSSVRMLKAPMRVFERHDAGGVYSLGQRIHVTPSPAGWPDRAEDWLGPDAVWKRVEWATRAGERSGGFIDARAVAMASLGPLLSDSSRQQIERASDGSQALALLLMAPEFQRR
ncbi:DUF1800 domain-containing protein [Piscinibacter terrae]|nr:DUF1800 domain-containing protein [Albitalea terrae]